MHAAREVDFAASEQTLTRAELDRRGLVQLPVVVGGVVASANRPGIASGRLRLDGPLLAEVMLGRVRQWNDPRIRALNPGLPLPPLPVTRVVRQDASGTSLLFSSWLSRVSADFARSPGAIGYMEHAVAAENQLPTIAQRNRFGSFLASSSEHVAAAVRAADWELMYIDTRPSFEMDTADAGCPLCWPLVGLSCMIAPTRWADAARAAAHGAAGLTRGETGPEQGRNGADTKGFGWPVSGAARPALSSRCHENVMTLTRPGGRDGR